MGKESITSLSLSADSRYLLLNVTSPTRAEVSRMQRSATHPPTHPPTHAPTHARAHRLRKAA